MEPETLMTAFRLGLIDEDALQEKLIEKYRQQEKQKHRYKISHLPNGRWQTYVRDSLGNLIQVKGRSYEDIIDKLVLFKMNQGAPEYMTLEQLYQKWTAFRKETVANANTLLRDEQHYKRYFENQTYFRKKVSDIHRPDLKEFCCRVIRGETMKDRTRGRRHGGPLTRKEWTNAKSILNGMFLFAVDKEWLPQSPLAGMTFDAGLFRQPKPRDKSREIYNSDEKDALIEWCSAKYAETNDSAYMLPVLNFRLGLRIGEAVALKWSDWRSDIHLDILRTEYKDYSTNLTSIVEHTKTFRSRTLILSSVSSELLKKLRDHSGSPVWIFSRNGERLTGREANYIFEKYAADTGRIRKSSHKIRKTCGSDMCKAGFTPRQCADYLGNSIRVFEDYYEYDTDTDEEFLQKLNRMK